MAWSVLCIVKMSQKEDTMYNPFEVLGISPGANEKIIKRAYKVMSLRWHPDKAGKAKEEASKRFVEINKAYKTLTDPVARQNWEEYGNPDGPTTFSLGIALPAWLVDAKNSFWVLALYALGFGILVPFLVSQSWNASTRYTKDNILQTSMALFYRQLSAKMNMKDLAELIGQALEFTPENGFKWSNSSANTSDATDTESFINFCTNTKLSNDTFVLSTANSARMTDTSRRVFCHLFCQFHRIELPHEAWKQNHVLVITKAVHLSSGILKIALVRDWPVTSLNTLTLAQFLIQAVWENDLPLLQLPYFTAESAAAFHAATKKPTIRDFLALPESERLAALQPLNLAPQQLENLLNVANNFPDCNVINVDYKILGQEEITPEGIITCVVKLKLSRLQDAMKLDMKKETERAKAEKVEIEQFAFDEDGNMVDASSPTPSNNSPTNSPALQPIHAPFYPSGRRANWWVFLLSPDLQTFICPPVLVRDLFDEKMVTLQFQTPPRPGLVNLRLMVRSDCLYGADLLIDSKFTIHKESKVQKVVDSDWDISDSESESESPFGTE